MEIYSNPDHSIRYYEIRMQQPLGNTVERALPEGYSYRYFEDGDRDTWIGIEKSAGEFSCFEEGVSAWERYYQGHEEEIKQRMFFVVAEDGEAVATATAYYDNFGNDKTGSGWVHWVAVKREHQGKGISKPLVTHVLKRLEELGYTNAIVPTQTTTWVACKVYMDLGFRPIPKNAQDSRDGYRILKTLTHHAALADFDEAKPNEIFIERGKDSVTDIYFSFDTEDFTNDHAADAIRDEALLLTKNGIRGNFNIVGYLAQELVRNKRWDVLEALKPHVISYHTLRHSYHPTLNEYTDVQDHEQAAAMLNELECEGYGMVKAVTGADKPVAFCPPGNSMTSTGMYWAADKGMRVYLGSLFETYDGAGVFFCNGFHTNYDIGLEGMFHWDEHFDMDAFIEKCATMRRVVIYNHPNMVEFKEFWDAWNYNGTNQYPMHEWKEPPRHSKEAVSNFYKGVQELIDRLKADKRFAIRDVEYLDREAASKMDGRTVTKDMLGEIKRNLQNKFTWMQSPVPLCVADCFYAAKHFLTGEEPFVAGNVHGFLFAPEGTQEKCTLTKAEVLALAENCKAEEYLPPYQMIHGKKVGPADLLFAMLDIAMGAESVEIEPKAQQCDYSAFTNLETLSFKDTWMHSKDFQDNYVTDRLRLQAWTLRSEQ